MNILRFALRLPLLVWHVLIDLPIVLLLMLPPLGRIDVRGEPLEHRVIRWWQGGMMRIFGFRMRRRGVPLPGATLFVANHVSWVDIVALHSQRVKDPNSTTRTRYYRNRGIKLSAILQNPAVDALIPL